MIPISPPWARDILHNAQDYAMEDANAFDYSFLTQPYETDWGVKQDTPLESDDDSGDETDGVGTQTEPTSSSSSSDSKTETSSSSSSDAEPKKKKRKKKAKKAKKPIDLGYLM